MSLILIIVTSVGIYFAYSNIQYNKYYKSIKKGTILRDVNKNIIYNVEFKIEDAVVGTYQKIEDKFVEKFLEERDETSIDEDCDSDI